jgi:formate dehydrogenase subunit gamma
VIKKENCIANTPDIVSDSTKTATISEVKKGLPGYYFPLVIGIILVETVILILVLLNILPRYPFEIYPTAGYFGYLGTNDISQISVTITRWFFFALTAGVLLPNMVIIILEVIRRVIINRLGESSAKGEKFRWLDKLDRSPQNPNLTKDRIQGNYIVRFDVHQRIQHGALFTSFIILAVTGLLRGFPEWPTFQWFMNAFGGPDVLRLVHDGAALVMVLDCIYHLGYIAHGYFVKGKIPYAMLPNLKDLKDIIHSFLWIFGIYKYEPEYEHFAYGQKIDYLAIFWGMPLMVITGIIMMFPVFFSQWFAGQWFAVVATAHRDEAVLATGFIIIVHMYYGHLGTTAFPVNTVMFTGRMLKSKYKQWFGREYAQLTGEKND